MILTYPETYKNTYLELSFLTNEQKTCTYQIKTEFGNTFIPKTILHEISTVRRDYANVIVFHRQNVLEVKKKTCIFPILYLIINLRILHKLCNEENS